MKRMSNIVVMAVMSLFAISIGYTATSRNMAAYVTHAGGLITQYSSNGNGGFVELPSKVSVKGYATRVVVDTSGRFAYVGSQSGISVFSIDKRGSLTPLGTKSTADGKAISDIAIDKSGSHLYASVADKPRILQYKIKPDGALAPLSKPQIGAVSKIKRMIVHPVRPLLFVVTDDGLLSRFRICDDGTLAPAKPKDLSAAKSAGDMTFSASGDTLYLVDESNELILQYSVDKDGYVTFTATPSYHDEMHMSNGEVFLAVSSTSNGLLMTNDYSSSVYALLTTPRQKDSLRMVQSYKIARDNKVKDTKQFHKEMAVMIDQYIAEKSKDEWKSDGGDPSVRKKRDLEAYNNGAIQAYNDVSIPRYVTLGPDGRAYVLHTSGVTAFVFSADGSISSNEAVITWPDEIAAATSKMKEKKMFPVSIYLTVIQR